MAGMTEVMKNLTKNLRRHRRAALLFSGGLDSSLVLAAAARTLGPGLCAITMVKAPIWYRGAGRGLGPGPTLWG